MSGMLSLLLHHFIFQIMQVACKQHLDFTLVAGSIVTFNSLRAYSVSDSATDLICDFGQVMTQSGFKKGPPVWGP